MRITDTPEFDGDAWTSIIEERGFQVDKWGVQNHSLDRWMTILTEEVGEVAKAILELDFTDNKVKELQHELSQVAAVAIAVMTGIENYLSKERGKE